MHRWQVFSLTLIALGQLAIATADAHPAVEASDAVFILLSPDGSSPAEKLHHASLYQERYLGTRQIPEPASSTLLVVGLGSLYATHRHVSSNCSALLKSLR